VAKGAKKPSSNFRPVLLPLQPLNVSYSGDAEIRTLKGAEWVGGHIMPTGEALLSGYYLNELLLRLLARDDPHTGLFDIYRQTVKVLSSGLDNTTAPLLRAFELLLLQDIGFLPDLTQQTLTLQPLQPEKNYALLAEAGLRASQQAPCLSGAQWLQLRNALQTTDALTALLRVCAEWPGEDRAALQTQLRNLLHYHCGVNSLRTRQVMMELQSL
jgi:DNA repair protein RecO (recombination protein O)